MKTKRDKRDAKFSLLVRERDCNICIKCGKNGEEWQLHCSHIFSRRHVGLRWHPDNAKCLCFSCHKWWHESPVESGLWIRELFGDDFIDALEVKKNQITKYSKIVKEDIYQHLKSEYEIMMDKRLNGVEGRIEFKSYEEGL